MEIKKLIKNNFKNSFVKLILLPGILILFWFLSSLLLNSKYGFSVLTYSYPDTSFENLTYSSLKRGDILRGKLESRDNYLGILALRFNQFNRVGFEEEEIFEFRLKENGKNNWYYKNRYRTGGIHYSLLFPIGFPTIADSRGKLYVFELESINGNSNNAISLSKNKPLLFSYHQYPKAKISNNLSTFQDFVSKKIISSFSNLDFVISSVIFMIPLLVYFFLLLIFQLKGNSRSSSLIAVGVWVLIFGDIFLLSIFYLGVYLSLILLWLVVVKYFNISNVVSFIFAFLLVCLWIVLLSLSNKDYQDKLNVWTYSFLIIGTIQLILEEKLKIRNMVTHDKFFKNLINFFNIL